MSSPGSPSRWRAAGRLLLLIAGIGLTTWGVCLVAFATSMRNTRLGIPIAFWGVLLGYAAIRGTSFRGSGGRGRAGSESADEADAAGELELRASAELVRERDQAARREYELQLELMLRRELEQGLREELAGLRRDVAELRGDVLDAVDGRLRLERVEITRIIGSNLAALQGDVRRLPSSGGPAPSVTVSSSAFNESPPFSDSRTFGGPREFSESSTGDESSAFSDSRTFSAARAWSEPRTFNESPAYSAPASSRPESVPGLRVERLPENEPVEAAAAEPNAAEDVQSAPGTAEPTSMEPVDPEPAPLAPGSPEPVRAARPRWRGPLSSSTPTSAEPTPQPSDPPTPQPSDASASQPSDASAYQPSDTPASQPDISLRTPTEPESQSPRPPWLSPEPAARPWERTLRSDVADSVSSPKLPMSPIAPATPLPPQQEPESERQSSPAMSSADPFAGLPRLSSFRLPDLPPGVEEPASRPADDDQQPDDDRRPDAHRALDADQGPDSGPEPVAVSVPSGYVGRRRHAAEEADAAASRGRHGADPSSERPSHRR